MRYLLICMLFILTFGCSDIPEGIYIDNTIGSDEIYSRLIMNPKNATRPLVIVIPGSGGSYMPDKHFFGLVQDGYDVLSIAYFGKQGLPKNIEHIPLEYLEKVISIVKKKYTFRKMVLLGISKGAEYTLTFASYYHLVDGIICYSPSSFVLPNHVGLKENENQKSSWVFNDTEVPFAELRHFSDKAGIVTYKNYIQPILNDSIQLKKSRIKVENIRCNLLLLSGEDDLVWPSAQMGELIKSKIEESNSNINVEHISFKNCGHQFVWFDKKIPEHVPQYQSMNLTGIKKHKFIFGGNKEATIKAMVESKNKVIEFLKKIANTNNKGNNLPNG